VEPADPPPNKRSLGSPGGFVGAKALFIGPRIIGAKLFFMVPSKCAAETRAMFDSIVESCVMFVLSSLPINKIEVVDGSVCLAL
jgi:hypothetical protein